MTMKNWAPILGLVLAGTLFGASTAIAGGGGPTDPRDTAGVFRNVSDDGFFYLRSSNDPACTGATVTTLPFGAGTDTPLAIDTDGDGLDQIAVFRDTAGYGEFFIAAANTPAGTASPTNTPLGAVGDIPIAGDFDIASDGDELGVFRPSTQEFFLTNGAGAVVTQLVFGDPGDVPIVGNWDDSADGSDEIGVFRASNNTFYLRADNASGSSSVTQQTMGASGDEPATGDFDRDGRDTIGVFRNNSYGTFYLNDMTTGGVPTEVLDYGDGQDTPVLGDWDGPTTDETGCTT